MTTPNATGIDWTALNATDDLDDFAETAERIVAGQVPLPSLQDATDQGATIRAYTDLVTVADDHLTQRDSTRTHAELDLRANEPLRRALYQAFTALIEHQGEPAADRTIDAYPKPTEVAVVHLPAGRTARVHRPNGAIIRLLAGDTAQVHHPDGTSYTLAPLYPGAPLVAVIAADPDLIGWGAIVLGETLATIRNNHHRADRPTWHQAARAVRHGGIAYVTHEKAEEYGRTVWRATGIRTRDRLDP